MECSQFCKADLSKSDVTTALGYTPPTTNTTYNDVTQSAHGLMTAADKKKLDGIASGATKVTDSTVAGWGYKKTDTNTWRPLGTTADTACAGNDSRLSNARPASDVSAWAKASTKPTYTMEEIGSKPQHLHQHHIVIMRSVCMDLILLIILQMIQLQNGVHTTIAYIFIVTQNN